MQISQSIFYEIFKLSVVVLNNIMGGTVSQISFSGPKSSFMQFENQIFKNCKMFPIFYHERKAKP